jgi:hypothetical protein
LAANSAAFSKQFGHGKLQAKQRAEHVVNGKGVEPVTAALCPFADAWTSTAAVNCVHSAEQMPIAHLSLQSIIMSECGIVFLCRRVCLW